ncbi:receptor-like protein EIX1 [Camellia sinensis]|uniref:receptor-like protein EIX1 n=1 Tax=Camellia sinensis TaxID=4442 RepID=UPI001036B6C9|nr:receptor-like protein EIX1 [Camellia sinensis]
MISLAHLDLSSNRLEGGIPKSFSNLSRLQSLDLYFNKLNDSLSTIIQVLFGSMENSLLEFLQLSRNQLRGSLPNNISFPRLTDLHLDCNLLDGSFPETFGQPLWTLSRRIGQLPKLEVLDVNSNHLEGLVFAAHLSNLSRLQFLDLSLNSLVLKFNSGWIPPFHLDTIRLRSCKLGPHFPKWLQTQKNVSVLDISAAGISATIPSWFWDLSPRMRLLNISYNHINGIMPDLSLKFPAFPAIDLSSNHFAGPIPFLRRTATSLNLSKNKFSGSLGSISKLKVLQFRNNSFTGELPLPLRNCINLIIIDLGDNRISGTIPTWIGESLSMLVVFSLRSNEFHGSIPTNFCQLNNIQILDLSLNNISGTIPMCLDNFLAMTQTLRFDPTIYVIYDQTYTIRDGEEGYYSPHYVLSALLVWKGREYEYKNTLGLVKSIDLSSNKLTGEIPSNITRLVGLVAMNFSRNRLAGPMPAEIGDLKLLESLDLSRNQLSGGIPISLSNLNFLSHLDLSDNNLSGRIPLSTQLQSLDNSTFVGNLNFVGHHLQKCAQEMKHLRIQKDQMALMA